MKGDEDGRTLSCTEIEVLKAFCFCFVFFLSRVMSFVVIYVNIPPVS